MGSENAHGCTQNAENFTSRIVRVTGDESWVSFVNVETKEQ
jgi:hypothetical protein